ncbi:hypothetical protein [Deinococcus aquiradiocola]|nr:hypothetical protein [Deinococcus aquiradiocola]
MNRNVLPLCALLLTVSLAACAPMAVRTAGGATVRPHGVAGFAALFVTRVPAAQITDQTPDSSYATFEGCSQVAVLVQDVRQLGLDASRQFCLEAERNIQATTSFTQTLAVFAFIPVGVFLYYLFSTFFHVLGG